MVAAFRGALLGKLEKALVELHSHGNVLKTVLTFGERAVSGLEGSFFHLLDQGGKGRFFGDSLLMADSMALSRGPFGRD